MENSHLFPPIPCLTFPIQKREKKKIFFYLFLETTTTYEKNDYPYSPRARNRFNQVVEAKRFEGVFLCRKVC